MLSCSMPRRGVFFKDWLACILRIILECIRLGLCLRMEGKLGMVTDRQGNLRQANTCPPLVSGKVANQPHRAVYLA